MNDLGEDGEAGTPGMRSEMRTYPSLFFFFTPAAPPLCDRPSFFSEKVWHVCCPHSISHGTLFEKTIHACCQRVFVRWMESPPSTSSPTYQFGLNPLEMSKSRREQKGLTHRDPLCSGGGPGGGLVSDVAVCHSKQGLNKHTGSSVSLTQTHTKMPCWHSFVVRNLRRLSLYLYLYERGALLLGLSSFSSSSFSTLSQHIHLMCFPAVNLAVVSVESPHHLDKGNLYFPPQKTSYAAISWFFWHPNLCVYVCAQNSFF